MKEKEESVDAEVLANKSVETTATEKNKETKKPHVNEDFILNDNTTNQLNDFHEEQLAEARKTGESDGIRNIPRLHDANFSPYEKRVLANYQSMLEQIAGKGKELLYQGHQKAKALMQKLEHRRTKKTSDLVEILEKERDRKLDHEADSLSDKLKNVHNSADWVSSKRAHDSALKRLNIQQEKHKRDEPLTSLPTWGLIMILAVIGLSELGLNYQVFESLGEAPIMTLVLAFSLVIVLPWLAHTCGVWLRQAKEHKTGMVYFFICTVAVLVGIYILSKYREAYLKQQGVGVNNEQVVEESSALNLLQQEENPFEADDDTANPFEQEQDPFAEVGSSSQDSGFDVEDNLNFWLFLAIGFLLFAGGIFASYSHTDPSPTFHNAYKHFKKAEENYQKASEIYHPQLARLKEESKRRVAEIHEEFTAKSNKRAGDMNTINEQIYAAIGLYNKNLASFQALEKKVNNMAHITIQEYRRTNFTFRENCDQPKSWSPDIPELTYRFEAMDFISRNEVEST